MLPQLLYEIP